MLAGQHGRTGPCDGWRRRPVEYHGHTSLGTTSRHDNSARWLRQHRSASGGKNPPHGLCADPSISVRGRKRGFAALTGEVNHPERQHTRRVEYHRRSALATPSSQHNSARWLRQHRSASGGKNPPHGLCADPSISVRGSKRGSAALTGAQDRPHESATTQLPIPTACGGPPPLDSLRSPMAATHRMLTYQENGRLQVAIRAAGHAAMQLLADLNTGPLTIAACCRVLPAGSHNVAGPNITAATICRMNTCNKLSQL
jgi:hypothetical protein